MHSTFVFYKCLLFLTVISAVFSEHQKRDVHRIIIQERVPRSHKKGNPGHNRVANGHKKGKYPRTHGGQESGSSSYEDGGSYSREKNSFEEVFRSHKTHKSPSKKKPAHRHPRHPTHQEVDETHKHSRRQESNTNYQNDWIPLNSDQVMQHSQENYRVRDKKNKRKDGKGKQKKHTTTKTPRVLELTTSYPLLHYEESTLYPSISLFTGDFMGYNANKNVLEEQQLPSMSNVHPTFDFTIMKDQEDRLKNHRPTYDVTEEQSSAVKSYLLVSDNKPDSSSNERDEIIVGHNPKTHTRSRNRGNRGRVMYFDEKY